jgi:hypothetical protein
MSYINHIIPHSTFNPDITEKSPTVTHSKAIVASKSLGGSWLLMRVNEAIMLFIIT